MNHAERPPRLQLYPDKYPSAGGTVVSQPSHADGANPYELHLYELHRGDHVYDLGPVRWTCTCGARGKINDLEDDVAPRQCLTVEVRKELSRREQQK